MPNFKYKGKNEKGEPVEGIMTSESRDSLIKKLMERKNFDFIYRNNAGRSGRHKGKN